MSEFTVAENEAAVNLALKDANATLGGICNARDAGELSRAWTAHVTALSRLPEFAIIDRNRWRTYFGRLARAVEAAEMCRICNDPFGFNIPIVVEDVEMRVHLSCQIAAELKSPFGPRSLSSDDYDDIAGQVGRFARLDARVIDDVIAEAKNEGRVFSFTERAEFAIIKAFEAERRDRDRFSKTLDAEYQALTNSDRTRLFWRYVAVLANERERAVRS